MTTRHRPLPFVLSGVLAVGLSIAGPAAATETTTAAASDLAWSACTDAGLAAGGFECATLRVPKDRRRPNGPTFALAVVRHRATGAADQRIGSLVFNPGGPGGSGLDAIASTWELVPEPVRQRFDLVSWDPRGVGASSPSLSEAGCRTPFPVRPLTGSVRWPAVTKRFVRDLARANAACVERIGDDVDHMGTMEAVEDLERIRAAVGDQTLTYWGMSYGTRIGYVYALRYPDRVRAIVLDGSIDPAATVLGLTEGGAAPDQAYGSFAQAFPASDRRWAQLRRVLNERTVRLARGQVLDRSVALDIVYGFVAQQSAYRFLADTIDAWHTAIVGSGEAQRVAKEVAAGVVAFQRDLPNSNAGGVFSMVNCLDYADRPSTSRIVDAVQAQRRLAPRYGAPLALMYGAGCAGMRVTPDPIPVITGEGPRTRVLVLGASRDGSTIVQWTARMSRAFPLSRTVTYAGGQHVTWGFAGSDCVDAVANAYVLDLAMPATDLACPNVYPSPR